MSSCAISTLPSIGLGAPRKASSRWTPCSGILPESRPTASGPNSLRVGRSAAISSPHPFRRSLRRLRRPVWRFCRSFSLDYARVLAKSGNIVGAVGQAAKAILEEAHAILCERGQWVLNEKRLIETAGLAGVQSLFVQVPNDSASIVQWIDLVADQLGVSQADLSPWVSRN